MPGVFGEGERRLALFRCTQMILGPKGHNPEETPMTDTQTFKTLEFYFDFSSPYGYLAAEKIDELAAKFGRKVKWRRYCSGVIFKATGAAPPLTMVPFKGEYSKLDFARSARFFRAFPITRRRASRCRRSAARAYLWLHDCSPAQAAFANGYRAFFVDDRDISDMNRLFDIAADVGADSAAVAGAVESAEIKDRLKAEGRSHWKRAFSAHPTSFATASRSSSADRLPQLEARLAGKEF